MGVSLREKACFVGRQYSRGGNRVSSKRRRKTFRGWHPLRAHRSRWLYSSRAGTPSSSRSNCRGSSNKFAARLRMPLLTPQGHRFGVLSPHCAPGHKLPNQAPGHPWIFDLRSISMHDRILTVDPTEYPSWTVATIEIHGEYRKVREEAGGYTIAYPTF